jgi:hypothetical protein
MDSWIYGWLGVRTSEFVIRVVSSHSESDLYCLQWQPAVLPIQILRIGQIIILSVPGGTHMQNPCSKFPDP